MTKLPALTCFLIAMLTACSAMPTLTTPDGRHRTSVNTNAAIEAYKASMAAEVSSVNVAEQTDVRLETIRAELAELKSYMSVMAMRLEESLAFSPSGPRTAAPSPRDGAPILRAVPGNDTESLMITDQSVMFRIAQRVGASEFSPSVHFGAALLRLSRAGGQINVRAGSDSETATPANVKVVNARAARAREFLATNDIPTARMKISIYSSGHFVADNTTPAGKALNRRTEIEISGVNPNEVQAIMKQFSEVMQ